MRKADGREWMDAGMTARDMLSSAHGVRYKDGSIGGRNRRRGGEEERERLRDIRVVQGNGFM